MSSFHVLIAGGGIGGLCLAQGLRQAGISCTVFESTPGIVRAGYRLHMNSEGGHALRQCLPEHLYELYMETSGTPFPRDLLVVLDHLGNEVATRPHIGPPNDPERPHTAVNRRTLRQIMATGLDEVIRFGHTVTGFETDGEQVRLLFEDGSTATGDVLVAADGINSAVRRQLLPEVPVLDTGLIALYGLVPLTDELIARLPEAIFESFAGVVGPGGSMLGCGVFLPRTPIAEAVASLAPGAAIDPVGPRMMVNMHILPDSPLRPRIMGGDLTSPEAQHDVIREAVRGWDPAFVDLVEHIETGSIFPISLRYLEPAEPWSTSRVTLLGDAIHAMPPTFGAGANTALRDAAALTQALTAASRGDSPLLDAISAYEAEMRVEVYPILRAASDPRAFDADFLPDDVSIAGP
ncbi:FAD-dependent oxidoreductase [Streptomyces canus]|uniref:FAD-dependent oxidoreductase n=1 Tax=Streptomyces canus TaxID=58343 RepID=UPI0033A61B30